MKTAGCERMAGKLFAFVVSWGVQFLTLPETMDPSDRGIRPHPTSWAGRRAGGGQGEWALEEQRLQAQRMESVGRLAGGVAHDFNNLLTVITGRSQLALNRLAPDDPVRRDIEQMATTAGRAARHTQQLLTFSRKQVLRPEVMNLNSLVERMEASLLRPIDEHIEIVTTLAPALWAVRADPAQLEQLIMNLALNARDAMPTGGRLMVETANVAVGAEMAGAPVGASPGDHVLLQVSDTGVGMDPATRARMFEPFFTTKEEGKRTGLGLSSVYGVLQQSGGHMTVESEPEQGTTIRRSTCLGPRPGPQRPSRGWWSRRPAGSRRSSCSRTRRTCAGSHGRYWLWPALPCWRRRARTRPSGFAVTTRAPSTSCSRMW